MRNPLPRRRLVAGSAAALVLLAGGVTATAVSTAAPSEQRALAMRFEAHPAHAARTEVPGMTVPEDAEWSMPAPDAKAEPPAPDPREVAAASRAAQRRELAQQEAAQQEAAQREAAQQQAAQQQAAQQQAAQQQEAAQQQAAQQQAAQQQAQQQAAQEQRQQAPTSTATGSERGTLTAMLNNYRASNGLATLSRDPGLDQAAQQWAQWMAQNQALQHSGYVNGSQQRAAGWNAGSEIIVRYRGGGALPSGEITSFMHSWWRGSPVHNANMLKSGFTHVGTGYAMGPGGPYAVHIFGG